MTRYTIAHEPEVDATEVLGLDLACFPSDTRVTVPGSLWWIVRHRGRPVGYAGLYVCEDPDNRGLGFLCRVGVLAEHRGHGLQGRLIRARERTARRLGLKELVTYCVPWNEPSVNSLIKCGYRLYRPASRWGGGGAVYLRKRL
jgi:GNAT superfamily N-acetyltransferase